jgi:hypothetical protein
MFQGACDLSSAGDLLQPGSLLRIRLVQALEQLPGFGFELAQEGEVTFSMLVCHGHFSVHVWRDGMTAVLLTDADRAAQRVAARVSRPARSAIRSAAGFPVCCAVCQPGPDVR